MSQIIKGSFEASDDCDGCQVEVESSYLARQGAVFNIKSYAIKGLRRGPHGISYGTSHGTSHGAGFSSGVIDLDHIPDMVNEILMEVSSELDIDADFNFSSDYETDFTNGSQITFIDKSARRELAREQRDIEFELRDYEIELMRLDDDDDKSKTKIEEKIAALQSRRDALEEQQREEHERIRVIVKDNQNQQLERRAKIEAEQAQALEKIQDVVVQTFCDYGSTLKNLPNKEHVSLIFERRQQKNDVVYIFDKDQIMDCESDGQQLKANALSYNF